MKWIPKFCLALIYMLTFVSTSFAQSKILIADARPRPPEINTDEPTGNVSGPIVDIFNEAAKKLGYQVH
jgi:hypothetical protein